MRIEDYALIGDTQAAGLVGRNGSIDWLCLPRFDSGACFSALLGTERHGRWLLAPAAGGMSTSRRYRGDSLVLETTFETPDGTVRIIDCMPPRRRDPDVVRVVEGVSGRVPMRMELAPRFDYGRSMPWVRRIEGRLHAIAGPDSLVLDTPIDVALDDEPESERSSRHGGAAVGVISARFEVSAGDRIPFVLEWHPSHEPASDQIDALDAVDDTVSWWEEWVARSPQGGEWRDAVVRSLVTLKALTYAPTGGIVAAPTTSLPEKIGGVRNWDYRFCWLRDATLTLVALLDSGYADEAREWRDWLLRATAGAPEDLQIMYGCAGERRLTEVELDWLPGYEGSRPVRVGNAAVGQLQLDVYGEVIDALHQARLSGVPADPAAWELERALVECVEERWREPDEGIWEVRGPRRHFTHSKVMAWVAADRAVQAVEDLGSDGPVDRWRRLRDEIKAEVCERAWDAERGTFTQSYGSRDVDAALLLMPLVGFLPATDERIAGTVATIERELCDGGLVHRYPQGGDADDVDGLPPGEGAFLACTFWLADVQALAGRVDEARATFERVIALRNDVGLLAEEYDVGAGRLVGNFPQAFSHVPLIATARSLDRAGRGTGPRGAARGGRQEQDRR